MSERNAYKLVIALVVFGFPIALTLALAFELTARGRDHGRPVRAAIPSAFSIAAGL